MSTISHGYIEVNSIFLVKKKLAEEKAKSKKMFEDELQKPSSGVPDLLALTETGWDKDKILAQVGLGLYVLMVEYQTCLNYQRQAVTRTRF